MLPRGDWHSDSTPPQGLHPIQCTHFPISNSPIILVHTSIMNHTSVDDMNILLIRQTASARSLMISCEELRRFCYTPTVGWLWYIIALLCSLLEMGSGKPIITGLSKCRHFSSRCLVTTFFLTFQLISHELWRSLCHQTYPGWVMVFWGLIWVGDRLPFCQSTMKTLFKEKRIPSCQ